MTAPDPWGQTVPGLVALVLSGGRSTRMGRDKAALVLEGETMLERTVRAGITAGASRAVVVGPEPFAPGPDSPLQLARFVREDPPFGGPVAAVAAGLAALEVQDQWVLLLPVDLAEPHDAALTLTYPLRAGLRRESPEDGWIAVDETGYRQHATGLLRSQSLRRALGEDPAHRPPRMAELTGPLALAEVAATGEMTGLWEDVDTPADYEALLEEHAFPDIDGPDDEMWASEVRAAALWATERKW